MFHVDAAALLAVVVTGVVAATRFPGTSNKTQSHITAPVTLSDLREEVLASGTLKPARLTAVGAQVSGYLFNHIVKGEGHALMQNWQKFWLIPCIAAGVVMVLFFLLFRNDANSQTQPAAV